MAVEPATPAIAATPAPREPAEVVELSTPPATAPASDPESETKSEPDSIAPPALPPPPPPAVLRLSYAGAAFPVSVHQGSAALGLVDETSDEIPIVAGAGPVQLVNADLFLDVTVPAEAFVSGEERLVALPPTASAFIGVADDLYEGLRIQVAGHDVPGPYPAQVGRLITGPQHITFFWEAGRLTGRQIAQDIFLDGSGHYVIEARPQHGSVDVQKVR